MSLHTLFLDLASHFGSIAVVAEDHIVASEAVSHRLPDHEVMPVLEKVLEKAKIEFKDLTNIAVVLGPGGFTSLRVAVTLANVLSDQLKIPIAGVHLSDLYAARAGKDFLWLHSTKKTALFARTFDAPWIEPTLITLDDLKPKTWNLIPPLWSGELIPEHRAVVDALGLTEARLKPMEDVLPDFLKALPFTNKLPLLPWYGRGW